MSVPEHPIASLKKAIRAHLLADVDVASAVGTSVFDAPPRGVSPPYLHFGNTVARENGAIGHEGAIIEIDIVALTKERGTAAALAVASAIAKALGQPLPALTGHRLIALEQRQTGVQHDASASLTRATLRLRAFTEPL